MIGKIKYGTNFRGCLEYCLQPGKRPEILLINGLSGQSPNELDKQFRLIANLAPRVQKKVWHITISFAYEDHVTDALMRKVSEAYLEKMRLSEHQFIVIKHNDTDHEHLHIVANRVGTDGAVSRDWKTGFKTMKIMQELEVKFELAVAKDQQNIRKEKIKEEITKGLAARESIDIIMSRVDQLGYKVIYNKSTLGKVRGVSFIEKLTGVKMKLSSIDRKFTYIKLLRLTTPKDKTIKEIIDSEDKILKRWT